MTDRVKVGNVVTMRGCEVDTFDGIHLGAVRCGRPATWWTAHTGRVFFVCPEHVAAFEADSDASHEVSE